MEKLKGRYTSMLFICWLIYTSAYFCRVNYSLAIASLQAEFGWDKASIGMLASAFFWAYAIGQLINGRIGDRYNPQRFVAIGLAAAGLCNIGMGFAHSFGIMLILWLLNGYFQSMLWGPIIRTVSVYTPHERHTQMAVILSTSTVVGYLVSYQFIGRLSDAAGWRAMFVVPGISLIIIACYWMHKLRHFQEDVRTIIALKNKGNNTINATNDTVVASNLFMFIIRNGLWLIALICVLQGIIKEGLSTWGPTFLSESQNIDFHRTLNMLSFVPVMSLCGVLLVGVINKLCRYHEKRTLVLFFIACAVSVVALYFCSNSLTMTFISYSLISMSIMGVNTILITFIPLNFLREGRVSSTAGFLDCAAYVGAGLSGPLLGMLADQGGWKETTLFWIAAALISIVLTIISRDYKKVRNEEQLPSMGDK